MVQKKFTNPLTQSLFASLLCICVNLHAQDEIIQPRSVELFSSQEFSFVERTSAMFNIRPLKKELRSIENLRNTEAVGVIYLGEIVLGDNATPLSALRDVSVQISKGLDLDLALITDSTTSKSLAPHELLLLYHPQMVITLALTKVAEQAEIGEESDVDDTEQIDNSASSNDVISGKQYVLIGTYAIPVEPNLIPMVPPVAEIAE